MRIAICDYSGHPFQVQLSRELAKRGHNVLHLYFAEFQTPKGRLSLSAEDPPTLAIEPVSLGAIFAKHSFIRRRAQEIKVGNAVVARLEQFEPEIVMASNFPLDALLKLVRFSKAKNRRFIFWQQDIYSVAISKILSKKFGWFGGMIGAYYRSIERWILSQSDRIVVVSGDFENVLVAKFGVRADRVAVIENWAPLDEITPQPRTNPWSKAHGLENREVVLYTGTLGLKHDPAQILALAKMVEQREGSAIVVVSEGVGADWLREQARALNLSSLHLLPFQPYEAYPDVLASAHILISVLEPDAGSYSVPSKVLSYLCAARPIVLCAPATNLASRIVEEAGAGIVVSAGDHAGFVAAVQRLLDDSDARAAAGARARSYATMAFDISVIGDKFESLLR